jgi:hypothetical protein
MKVKDLTQNQSLSVPCPTCGAGALQPCLNHMGEARSESHLGRKLWVVEIVKSKRSQPLEGRKTAKDSGG